MKFYAVAAKCGHFGRHRFGLFSLYVRAESGKAAAEIVRWMPRVKHHQKDAIQSVRQIECAEYKKGLAAQMSPPYFNCHSKQEQRLYESAFADCIFIETFFKEYERYGEIDRRAKMGAILRSYRKIIKHGHYGRYDLGA